MNYNARLIFLLLMLLVIKQMGRELFISLGITILTSVTLFLYFRHRFKAVEHKVNTIFQLVQSHSRAPPPQRMPMMPPMQRDAYAPPRGVVLEEKQDPKELIEVSEDDESDSGSEGSVTSESDDDMNEAPITINQLEEADIKDIKIEPASNISMQEPQKINLDSDAGSLSDQSELSDLPSQENSAPSPVKSVESIPDYNKLNVKTLKQIAEDRGLQGFKKLRKPALVELLSK